MRWLVLLLGLGLLVSGLYLKWQEAPQYGLRGLSPEPSLLRRTRSGPVTGAATPLGAQVWLGIPYAAAPEGALRWRAPQQPARWTGPKSTVSYGPLCPQFASLVAVEDAETGTFIGDEDCLSLNVFAPRGADERAALPVMVFIHGGGNTIGSARPYDATRFAQEQGVLIVTLNYRLGVLGWFSHPALRSTAADPVEASGNFGLLDIIAALEWVRGNIGGFGGDPQRVTVFGESAGARNIYSLLATPLAANLFHGAIIQSGTAGTFTRERAENPVDSPQPGHPNSSHELLLAWLQGAGEATSRREAAAVLPQLADADVMDFIRELPLESVMEPVFVETGMYSAPALIRDGSVLPEEPLLDVFRQPENWNRVPVLAGTNRDEMKLFLGLSPRYTRQRFGFLPAARDPANYNLVSSIYTDQWKAVGVDEPLTSMYAGDPELPLFAYRFDWDDTRANWFIDLPELLGAAHGLELDFLFGPLFQRLVPGIVHDGNREGFNALSRAMRDYWAGFAYLGRPATGRSASLPIWPRWQPQAPRVMLLDEANDGGLRSEQVSVRIEDVKRDLAGSPGLAGRARCALYVDMFLNNNGVEELFSAREYQELGCAPFPSWSLAGESR